MNNHNEVTLKSKVLLRLQDLVHGNYLKQEIVCIERGKRGVIPPTTGEDIANRSVHNQQTKPEMGSTL